MYEAHVTVNYQQTKTSCKRLCPKLRNKWLIMATNIPNKQMHQIEVLLRNKQYRQQTARVWVSHDKESKCAKQCSVYTILGHFSYLWQIIYPAHPQGALFPTNEEEHYP